MTTSPRIPGTLLALSSCAAVFVAGAAWAGEQTPVSRARTADPAAESMRMYRDPATGELRAATPDEIAAERAARASGKRTPLAVKSHGGRMVSAVVGDRALEELVATRQASGKLVIEHRAASDRSAPESSKREER